MFAILVILAGAGMAMSFAFMWTISVLEMWAFDKVFLDANGQARPQWSTFVEPRLKQMGCDKALSLGGQLCCMTRSSVSGLWQRFMEQGFPWLKQQLQKYLNKKS
jgi:hypothetical protein